MSSTGPDILGPLARWPRALLTLYIVVTLVLGFHVTTMDFRTELAYYLPEGYESVEVINEIFETWPIGSISILVEAEDVTHLKVLREMESVIANIDTDPGDDGVTDGIAAVADLSFLIKTINSEVRLDRAAADKNALPSDQSTVDLYLSMLPESYTSRVLSADHQYALITLTANTRDVPSEQIAATVFAAINGTITCTMTAASQIFVEDAVKGLSFSYLESLLPLAGLSVALALLLIFRSVKKTIIALLPPLFAAAQTLGIIALSGNDLDITMIAVGPLIIGFGVAYSIYLINRFSEERADTDDQLTAVTKGGNKMIAAIFLSAVTTVVGFLALTLSDMPTTARMGVACALGVVLCFFAALIVVPALLILLRVDETVPERRLRKRQATARRARSIANIRPDAVIVIAVTLSLFAVGTIGNLQTEFKYTDLMPADLDELAAIDVVEEQFPTGDVSFILATGDMYNPATVQALDDLAIELRTVDGVLYASSLASVVKATKTDYSLMDIISILLGNPIDFGMNELPETRDGLRDAYNNVDSSQLQMLVNEDYSKSIIVLGLDMSRPIAETEKIIDEINGVIAAHQGDGSTSFSIVSGISVLSVDINTMLLENQFSTTLFSILFIFIALLAIFRSPKFAVVTMIPMLAVILWVLGLMPVLGITLNIATVMMTSILMGTGIDFGIQITQRLRQELARGIDPREAVRIAVQNQGSAMITTCAATIAGFGVVALIPIPAIQSFISLMALGLAASCLAAVFILPAVYMKLIGRGIIGGNHDDDDVWQQPA